MALRDLADRRLWLATESEILDGATTDEYFRNTEEVLDRNHLDAPVAMEAYTTALPYVENWAVAAGIYEIAKLLEGRPVDLWAVDEGEVFLSDATHALYEPVLRIEGRYRDFARFETAILGFLSSFSSITTRAARFRLAAGHRLLFSFGTRRVHPALVPIVERGCYLAGFDGVSNVLGAKLLKVAPSGTMPHALVQVVGEPSAAWRLFDTTIPPRIPRIALVDTFADEKTEAIAAWETLGRRLWGVRLDTPASRRGDFAKIIEEVRWELNLRGARSVKIIASGRLDEAEVARLRGRVDGFGIGTAVAYPPVIDFSAKIVEVEEGRERKFRAKRGGLAGRKQVYRSRGRVRDVVAFADAPAPRGARPLLRRLLRRGAPERPFEAVGAIRERLRRRLEELARGPPTFSWR